MAKRARGTTRPGQRRPIQRMTRPVAGPTTAAPPEGLSAAEVTRAAELEAGLVAAERAAHATSARPAERTRAADSSSITARRPPVAGRLAVEAAEEYRYVARDVRRIGIIGGSMFVILAIAFVVLQLAGVAQH